MTTPFRVLVTGSRNWTDRHRIETDLELWRDCDEGAVLIHGACPTGADQIADTIWTGWGLPVERHPADWERYGKTAGFRRNGQMVQLGADICLAYIRNGSRGATHTANLARQAGIVTLRRTEPEAVRELEDLKQRTNGGAA